MSRILAIGDVHGAYKALLQALERANYDPSNDILLFLGDIADGWSETKQCFDFIAHNKQEYNNIIYHLGNHDKWLKDWAKNGGWPDDIWYTQGGKATIESYHPEIINPWLALHLQYPRIPESHLQILESAKLYTLDEENRVFVHAGILPDIPIEEQTQEDFIWNIDWNGYRILWETAKYNHNDTYPKKLTDYNEIFIGHTSTWSYSKIPIKRCEVWNLDQGAGWHGKLSIMDIDTKEYWQSDVVSELYPDEYGRRR